MKQQDDMQQHQVQAGSNSSDHDDMGFADTQEQKKAASHNTIDYNHSYDKDLSNTGAGNPAVNDSGVSTAGRTTTSVGAGRGFHADESGNYAGPGTATDRGRGDLSETDFGTGVGDSGLGTEGGLDQRHLNTTE